MSWINTLRDNKFSIKTGDGKTYYPDWKDPSKSKEFNSNTYEFIDLDYSFVDRRKPKSSKYDLLILFQGADCWEQADDFEKSADDPRYWIVNHPIYGEIKGQPTSLSRNDSDINITSFSIEFWESNLQQFIDKKSSINDDIQDQHKNLSTSASNHFSLMVNPKPSHQTELKSSLIKIDSKLSKSLDNSNYNDYQQALSKGNLSINNLIKDPNEVINGISNVIDFISNLSKMTTYEKVTTLLDLINQIFEDYIGEKNSSFGGYFFESIGSMVISSMCKVSLSPKNGDYILRKDVESVSSIIGSSYSNYQKTLDLISTKKEVPYSSNFNTQKILNLTVKRTIYELFNLSFGLKQERTVETQFDSNLILLTHKYIGLDQNDENLDLFRKMNNISGDNLFLIKKGTKIKYFI